jgi:hypothetical protein
MEKLKETKAAADYWAKTKAAQADKVA